MLSDRELRYCKDYGHFLEYNEFEPFMRAIIHTDLDLEVLSNIVYELVSLGINIPQDLYNQVCVEYVCNSNVQEDVQTGCCWLKVMRMMYSELNLDVNTWLDCIKKSEIPYQIYKCTFDGDYLITQEGIKDDEIPLIVTDELNGYDRIFSSDEFKKVW